MSLARDPTPEESAALFERVVEGNADTTMSAAAAAQLARLAAPAACGIDVYLAEVVRCVVIGDLERADDAMHALLAAIRKARRGGRNE